jgi:protein-tyrosine sulfotransferase
MKNNWFKAFYLDMKSVLDGTSLFVHHLMTSNLKKSELLCTKDPKLSNHIKRIHQIFPKAKIVFMVRDGRATAYSLLTKLYVTKKGAKIPFEKNTYFKGLYSDHLKNWNDFYAKNYNQCREVGEEFCKLVKYEELVQHTEETMRSVVQFLGIEYTEKFLSHEKYVGSKIVLEPDGWSTDQVNQSIYLDSLKPWVGQVSYSIEVPMLATFNYTTDV